MWSECHGGRRNEDFFLIGNDVEGFGVCGSHWQFLWICDYFVFDSDRGGWIEEFYGDENILMFYF